MSQSIISLYEVTALELLLPTMNCKSWWFPAKAGPLQVLPHGPVAQEGAGAVVAGGRWICLSIILAEIPSFSKVFVKDKEVGGGGSEKG